MRTSFSFTVGEKNALNTISTKSSYFIKLGEMETGGFEMIDFDISRKEWLYLVEL